MNKGAFCKTWLCLCICLEFFSPYYLAAQNIDTIDAINGVRLKSNLNDYKDTIYVLTGEEAFYQNYPSIKASLLKNIEHGIQEGLYQGTSSLNFGQWQATNLSLVFYQDTLYKATWSFKRGARTDIDSLARQIDEKFAKVFDEPQADQLPEFAIMIWEGKKHRLQTFKEGSSEYSIEFRELDLSKRVEAVQQE